MTAFVESLDFTEVGGKRPRETSKSLLDDVRAFAREYEAETPRDAPSPSPAITSAEPSTGALIGRAVTGGAIEAGAGVYPPYAGARALAHGAPAFEEFVEGILPERTGFIEDVRQKAREAFPLPEYLKQAVDLPITGARKLQDVLFGEHLDEDEHPEARFERYLETIGQTVGLGAGLGKAVSLLSAAGPAAVLSEEGLRMGGADPEFARSAGEWVERAGVGADIFLDVRSLIKQLDRRPAQTIATLLQEEGTPATELISQAQRAAMEEGLSFEEALRRIGTDASEAGAQLQADVLPVFSQVSEDLSSLQRQMVPDGPAFKGVEQASSRIERGLKQARQQIQKEVREAVGPVPTEMELGETLKKELTARQKAARKPVSDAYKAWDDRYGSLQIPVAPDKLTELQEELTRVKSAVRAQLSSPYIRVDDFFTVNKLNETLERLSELEDHLVGVPVSELRNGISNLKKSLREAGLGDAKGLYGSAVSQLEDMLNDGLKSIGRESAVKSLKSANDRWKKYADTYYKPAVADLIDSEGNALAQAARRSIRPGDASAVRGALGPHDVEGWTAYGVENTVTAPTRYQEELIKQLFPAAKAGRGKELLKRLRKGEEGVTVASLRAARTDLQKAMQRASAVERPAIQQSIEEMQQAIKVAQKAPEQREAASRLLTALKKDEAILQTDLARELRQRLMTASGPAEMEAIVEAADSISPQAGSVARRTFIERLLLPRGAESTTNEVVAAFRKNKPTLERVLGELDVTEKDMYQMLREVDKLAEGIRPDAKVGIITRLVNHLPAMARFKAREPSPPPLR